MGQTANLTLGRLFTDSKSKAYDQLSWVKRDAIITNPVTGQDVFEQLDVEFPENWSLNSVNVVAQKYFAGTPGTDERESSLRQLIDRVVDTITRQGLQESYFDSEAEAEDFREELKYILVTQRAAFNSPVWFNIGVNDRPQQASSCFILGVEDTMPAILNWYKEEGLIFNGGSGSGTNLSKLRSSVEPLGKSAGTASGPLGFMRGADASAGAIKSGKTRRAAKMVILNIDHPDVEEFIWSKAIEERKARALQAAGFDMGLDGKDSFSVQYQNANNAVRVTDDFMQAVENDDDWDLKAVRTDQSVKQVKARDILRQFAEAAWETADPGMQFDTLINHWNTTPKAGRINGSNPYSEYMHIDNSACNLASINLIKYLRDDSSFDIEAFKHTVELMFTAQEILVGYSSYPTDAITKNARAYRELGLGYANLGATLMAQGLPYDSAEGRAQASAITALMTGQAYATSAKIARKIGPFAGYHKDREDMLRVLKQHRSAVNGIDASLVSEQLLSAAASAWDEAVELGELYGIRNSQASVLAPTGTIGLMMDCDTAGMEPALGLLKTVKSADGSTADVVNPNVPRGLKTLGYKEDQIKEIIDYVDVEKTIVGAPHLIPEQNGVFACSNGDNAIDYLGYVKMMAAVQPFISGAVSNTVNLPENTTVEEVEQLHIDAWKMGLKSISIYRDNCKSVATPVVEKEDSATAEPVITTDPTQDLNEKFVVRGAVRRELPKVRVSKTFEFSVAGSKGFVTVGEYEDGTPGEVFMKIAKQGSTLGGVMESLAISVSYGLQYGVPLKSYVHALTNMTFAPAGMTDDSEIRTATSLVDYIFKRLGKSYLSFDDQLELGLASIDDMPEMQTSFLGEEDLIKDDSDKSAAVSNSSQKDSAPTQQSKPQTAKVKKDDTAPMCYNCGNQTQRSGSCYVCNACGSTTGCS